MAILDISMYENKYDLCDYLDTIIHRLRTFDCCDKMKPYTPYEIQKAYILQYAWEFDRVYEAFHDSFTCYTFQKKYKKCSKVVTYTDVYGDTQTVRHPIWNKIHGKFRKALKYAFKAARRRIIAEISTWDKYAGHNDVLQIRARIGGGNWDEYKSRIMNLDGFLEKVDDYFDTTYCYLYFKISE